MKVFIYDEETKRNEVLEGVKSIVLGDTIYIEYHEELKKDDIVIYDTLNYKVLKVKCEVTK